MSLFICPRRQQCQTVQVPPSGHPPMDLVSGKGPRDVLARSRPTRPSLRVRPGSMDPAPTRPTSPRTIASPTLEKLHVSARTHVRGRVPRDSRLRRATRRRQAATNRSRSGERKTRARVVRGVPRGSGWPQTAKGGCSCLTAAPGWSAAAARPMLKVPMPPGSACWRSGFSAAGRDGGGDCDDGRSSGCRKSCVLRKKPARRAPAVVSVQNKADKKPANS